MLSKTGQKQAELEARIANDQIKEVRTFFPSPLYCHSLHLHDLLKNKQAAFGKYGPEIAEHLATGRPLIANDFMPTSGGYDRLTPEAAQAFVRRIVNMNVRTLLDKYSPYGEPEPEKTFADFDETGKDNVQ